jgi:hypothetical protein
MVFSFCIRTYVKVRSYHFLRHLTLAKKHLEGKDHEGSLKGVVAGATS